MENLPLFVADYQTISVLFFAFFILRPAVLLLINFYQIILKPFILLASSVVWPSTVISIMVDEYRSAFKTNDLFFLVEAYLIDNGQPSIVQWSKSSNSNILTRTIHSNQDIQDTFDGMQLKWSLRSSEKKFKIFGLFHRCRKMRVLELSFDNKYQSRVQSLYLPYVMEAGARIRGRNERRQEREDASLGWALRMGTSVIYLLAILVHFFS